MEFEETGHHSRRKSSIRVQVRRRVCLQTHSCICWWRKFSVYCKSHSCEWWTTDATTENSVGWQDTIPSETSSSRAQVLSEKGNIGPTHGVIQTGSENQWNPNVPTFEEWSIGRKGKKSACIFKNKNGYQIPGSSSENQHRFFKPSPASNVSPPPITTSKESINYSLWTQELHIKWWASVMWLQKKRKRNKVEGSISYYDRKRDDPYDWRCNSICLWFGHVCSGSMVERITRVTLAG